MRLQNHFQVQYDSYMDKFFTKDGSIFSVNQDCSLTEYNTVQEAFASNPICVVQAQGTYENMLVRGLYEHWYQNTKYLLFQPNNPQKVDSIKVGGWAIKSILIPRSSGSVSLHCAFIDPLGKVKSQVFVGDNGQKLLTVVFLKLREMNNHESGMHYELVQEIVKLKQEVDILKTKLASHAQAE